MEMKLRLTAQRSAWARGLSMACFSACFLGCGGPPSADYGKLGLVEISGTVTLDGQPLQNASIRFVDADGTFCSGATDRAGHYRMMLDSRKSGVIPGEKTVRISSRSPASQAGRERAEENPDAKPRATESVPACYNKKSILKIKVTTSDSAMDFDLKSDCSATTFK